MQIGGIILMTDGIFIGPIGPISKQGNTIGGICGISVGTGMLGMLITGRFGICGKGISYVVEVGVLGSVTDSLAIGVCTIWHLLLDKVTTGSIDELGA